MDSTELSRAKTQQLDLDELMERIRAEVAERKRLSGETAPISAPETRADVPDIATRRLNARELLALPVAEFVRGTHLAFFGREPQPDEFIRLRDRLLVNHVGRMRILREFRSSREARERRLHVDGFWQQSSWDRIYWSPPAKFGRFVGHAIGDTWRLPRRIRQFIARVEALERRAAEAAASMRSVQSTQVTDRQNAGNQARKLQEQLHQQAGVLNHVKGELHQTSARANSLSARADATDRVLAQRFEKGEHALAKFEMRQTDVLTTLTDHWRNIVDQKLRMEAFLTTHTESAPPAQRAESELFSGEKAHLLDALYLSFEDRYRGTRAEIKERQRFYLPLIEACAAVTDSAPVIDVGCGRGEWLELLAEYGIAARGYDLNRIAVEECRERGLDAQLEDALAALAKLPDASCAAITGFHIIEHIPFETIVELLDQGLRVLRPGGLIVLETPNPANLVVAAERFYFDPTHRNPLPSELSSYLLKSRGFQDVQVLPLHPVRWDSRREYEDPMLAYLQDKLFGPQDYGVVGRKAA